MMFPPRRARHPPFGNRTGVLDLQDPTEPDLSTNHGRDVWAGAPVATLSNYS